MKKRNLFLGVALISLAFVSCKDKNAMQAEQSVDSYVVYVDSIASVDSAEVQANWQAIDSSYQLKVSSAELALESLKEKDEAQQKIDAGKAKYDALKAIVEAGLATQVTDSTEVAKDSIQ